MHMKSESVAISTPRERHCAAGKKRITAAPHSRRARLPATTPAATTAHAGCGRSPSIDRIDLGNLGSGGIVRKAFDQSGVLLDRDAVLKPDALKEGMIDREAVHVHQ